MLHTLNVNLVQLTSLGIYYMNSLCCGVAYNVNGYLVSAPQRHALSNLCSIGFVNVQSNHRYLSFTLFVECRLCVRLYDAASDVVVDVYKLCSVALGVFTGDYFSGLSVVGVMGVYLVGCVDVKCVSH